MIRTAAYPCSIYRVDIEFEEGEKRVRLGGFSRQVQPCTLLYLMGSLVKLVDYKDTGHTMSRFGFAKRPLIIHA